MKPERKYENLQKFKTCRKCKRNIFRNKLLKKWFHATPKMVNHEAVPE